jgi:hypothetical protein
MLHVLNHVNLLVSKKIRIFMYIFHFCMCNFHFFHIYNFLKYIYITILRALFLGSSCHVSDTRISMSFVWVKVKEFLMYFVSSFI